MTDIVWIILWQINQSCHKMGHKCFLIWGDWLSCDPLRRTHDSQSPPYVGWLVIMWPSERVVGSLLRYFNVAVIPGFPDARICGRLPRFGTLVPAHRAGAHAALVLFPHFRYYAQRLRTCRRSLSLSQVGRVVRGAIRCSCQMSKRINMTSGGRVLWFT